MYSVEETYLDPQAQSYASSASESNANSTSSSNTDQAGANGSSASQNAEGAMLYQSGTGSSSASGSYGYSSSVSASDSNYNSSTSFSSSSSYSNSGSFDNAGTTSGGTTEIGGHQTTAGGTVTASASGMLNVTSSGANPNAASVFTTTQTFQTTSPTLTTTSAALLSGTSTTGTSTAQTTTAVSTTASGLTTSADSLHLLNGIYATTTSASAGNGILTRVGTVIFAFSEDAWLLQLDSSFSGMRELADFARHLGSSYQVPSSTAATVTAGIAPTSTFQSISNGIAYGTSQGMTSGVSYGSSSSAPALKAPPQGVPNTTQESDFTPQGTSETTYQAYSISVTSMTEKATGISGSSLATSAYETTASTATFAFDTRGRITGSTSAAVYSTTSTSGNEVSLVTTGGQSQSISGFSTTLQNGMSSESGLTSEYGSTATSAASAYSATSFLPVGTILEATFDPAVRFGTSGKFDSVDGPGGSVFYPFWSQVWGGLWMPMTYAAGQTTTYQHSATVTDSGDTGYTYLSATGPTISASYSWSGSQVSMTTATGSGTSTGSGATQFAMQAAGEDDASYFVSRGAGLSVVSTDQYGDVGLVAQGGDYVVGGTQWADQPAQLWLGSGIWGLTSYDATGGSSTGKVTITDPVSISMVESSIVVAARPIPSWQCVTATPGIACLAVFAVGG